MFPVSDVNANTTKKSSYMCLRSNYFVLVVEIDIPMDIQLCFTNCEGLVTSVSNTSSTCWWYFSWVCSSSARNGSLLTTSLQWVIALPSPGYMFKSLLPMISPLWMIMMSSSETAKHKLVPQSHPSPIKSRTLCRPVVFDQILNPCCERHGHSWQALDLRLTRSSRAQSHHTE